MRIFLAILAIVAIAIDGFLGSPLAALTHLPFLVSFEKSIVGGISSIPELLGSLLENRKMPDFFSRAQPKEYA